MEHARSVFRRWSDCRLRPIVGPSGGHPHADNSGPTSCSHPAIPTAGLLSRRSTNQATAPRKDVNCSRLYGRSSDSLARKACGDSCSAASRRSGGGLKVVVSKAVDAQWIHRVSSNLESRINGRAWRSSSGCGWCGDGGCPSVGVGDFVAGHVDPWHALGDGPSGGVGDRAGQRDHTLMSRYTQR